MREDEIARMKLEDEVKKGMKKIQSCKHEIRKCIDTVSAFVIFNTHLRVCKVSKKLSQIYM